MLTALVFHSCQHSSGDLPLKVIAQDRSGSINGNLELLTLNDSLTSEELLLKFKVDNYRLGAKTFGERSHLLANSKKGQHIHLIVDDQPYMAKYQDEFFLNLTPGKHVLLAFLSRSYHESVKDKKAFELREVFIGNDKSVSIKKIEEPSLFYSRPKGKYTLSDKEPAPILLDFYLVNTELNNETKVKATIDNHEFFLTEWKPYFIYGLEEGEHVISLELVDNLGQRINGESTYSGVRNFEIIKKQKK